MSEKQRTTPAPRPGDDTSPESTPKIEEQERVERDISDLLAGVERERDEYLELARRTKADFENYRKRVAGEAAQAEKRGRAELARGLIPVLDNLERALEHETADSPQADEHQADRPQPDERVSGGMGEASFLEGIRLVRDEFAAVLKRSGVESFEPAGEPFDPHLHEAMMTRPAEGDGAGKVLEVLEKGYRLDGQVLRPARVVVGEEKRPSGGKPPAGSAAG